MKKHLLKIFLAVFFVVLLTSTALAEVSVKVDSFGNYEETIYIEKKTGKIIKFWTKFGNKHDHHALNEDGDLNRDLRPAIKENIYQENYPYVVWPKFDGDDYEIAFSRWTLDGWERTVYVEETDNPFDDLDSVIDFDQNGRQYIAWWRNEKDIGRIYISIFIETKWMTAYPISEEGIDSRNPEIAVKGEGEFEIIYSTPDGMESRTIVIHFPDTITDDIDPFGANMIDIIDNSNSNYLE